MPQRLMRTKSRTETLRRKLRELDAEAVRPARAILAAHLAGTEPGAEDAARLAEIENQALSLRAELAAQAE